jgi:hypothetical protein
MAYKITADDISGILGFKIADLPAKMVDDFD